MLVAFLQTTLFGKVLNDAVVLSGIHVIAREGTLSPLISKNASLSINEWELDNVKLGGKRHVFFTTKCKVGYIYDYNNNYLKQVLSFFKAIL